MVCGFEWGRVGYKLPLRCAIICPSPACSRCSHILKNMNYLSFSLVRRSAALAAICSLALLACSPKYDWREVHGSKTANIPFEVTMPGKPAEYTRPVQLGAVQVQMTMVATQAGGATFAVGSARLADAKQAQEALALMKTALVKNIDGKVVQEKNVSQPHPRLQVEAKGFQQIYGQSKDVLLLGHFIAKDKQIFQVIVAGEDSKAMRDAADTFLTSFKP